MYLLRPLPAILLVIFCVCSFAALAIAEEDNPRRFEIDLDPKVTVFTGPLRADGTIDYIAALNEHFSAGVTNDTNAFRELWLLMPHDDEPDGHADAMMASLGITDAERKQGPVFVDWYDYAEQQLGFDFDEADAIYGRFYDDGPGAQDIAAYRKWVRLNEPVFERAAQAVQRPAYWAPLIAESERGLLIDALLPNLGNHRRLARGLQAWAYDAARSGDPDRAVRAIQTMRLLALRQSNEFSLISILVAISIDSMTAATVQELLADQLLPDAVLAQIDQQWRERGGLQTVADSIAVGEKCFGLDCYMQIVSGRLDADEFWMENGGFRVLGEIDLNRGLRQLSQNYFQIAQIARIKDYAPRQRLDELFEQQVTETLEAQQLFVEIEGVRVPNLLLSKKQRADAFTAMLVNLITPAIGSAANTETRFLATERCTLTAVAIERYRLKHGKLPATLDELVPAYLDAVPTDPFNNQSVLYKPNDRGFIVYTVGENLVDDTGLDDRREGDWVVEITWDTE